MRTKKPERMTLRMEEELRAFIRALAEKRHVDEADIVREVLWAAKSRVELAA